MSTLNSDNKSMISTTENATGKSQAGGPIPAKLTVEKMGSDSFRILKVTLAPGQQITVEPGAMASHDPQVTIETSMNGGFLSALISKFLGKESFFINKFKNTTSTPGTVYFTQSTPGDIVERELKNEVLFVEPGSFIARTRAIKTRVTWAGFASWLAGEGLFRLCFEGTGRIWYGSFGAIIEKEIVGDFIVDSGHLLSYPPTIKLNLKLPSNLLSSILSKEGFVLKLSGSGKVLLQTRSVKGLAQWFNPRFWG